MLEVTPNLDERLEAPLYVQLYQYMKEEISSGSIAAGTRLPPIRQLGAYLKVSRNTIEAAYQQLHMEGYVESRPRSGLYVLDIQCDYPSPPSKPAQAISLYTPTQPELEINFRYGNVDREHFPFAVWRKLTLECLQPETTALFTYGHPQGDYELRKELARYLHYSRGVVCTPEQIIIGAGIQHLIGQFSQLIQEEVKLIAMENPGYDGVRAVFERHGFPLKPIPLDEQGINLEALYQSKATAVYITPSHQFPCGMIMSVARRMKLLKWAERVGGIILEDDYDGEFRYVGKPIPALQGLDVHHNVVYIGSLSKSFLPSLRIGYMILPPALLERYQRYFALYDQAVSSIHQLTLRKFMEQGYWDRHIRKMRIVYQRKQQVLITEIKKRLGSRVRIMGKEAGLHILLEVHNGMTEEELIQQALRYKVGVYPVSRHWVNPLPTDPVLVQLGFGALTEEQMVEGIRRLELAWFQSEEEDV